MPDRRGKGQSKHKEVRTKAGEVRRHGLFGKVVWFTGRMLGKEWE